MFGLTGFIRFTAVFALTLALGVTTSAWAAGEASGPQLGLKTGTTLTGRFVHEHPVQGFDQPLRSEGTFLLSPGKQMKWAIEKPMATTTLVDSNGLTQSVGNFVLLKMTPQQMPFLAIAQEEIIAGLNGDWKKLEKDFAVKRTSTKSGWQVVLTPRAEVQAPFQRLTATGSRYVDRVVVEMKTATDTIVFSDQKLEKAAP